MYKGITRNILFNIIYIMRNYLIFKIRIYNESDFFNANQTTNSGIYFANQYYDFIN